MFTRDSLRPPEFESNVPYLYDPRTRESRHSAGNKAPKAPWHAPWQRRRTLARIQHTDMRRSWYRCT